MVKFDIPVVVFLFKRIDKTALIIDQISKIRPLKLYLIADGPRNEEEKELVMRCRQQVEEHITWDCEVVKNYAEKNRGVYENIAGGAKWVFEREKYAIFLEDDNFPAISFFQFCREMLMRYEHDSRILWICGTNYLKKYQPSDGSDYVFSRLMFPCGWASWSDKFLKFYDGELALFADDSVRKKVLATYTNRALANQDLSYWQSEYNRKNRGERFISWDYQMSFSIRAHSLLGIVPKNNLIKNIGVDEFSIHGGTSMTKTMTKRFCEIEIDELDFPLKHPPVCLPDPTFEKLNEKIILAPLKSRLKHKMILLVKKILRIKSHESFRSTLKRRIGLINS